MRHAEINWHFFTNIDKASRKICTNNEKLVAGEGEWCNRLALWLGEMMVLKKNGK